MRWYSNNFDLNSPAHTTTNNTDIEGTNVLGKNINENEIDVDTNDKIEITSKTLYSNSLKWIKTLIQFFWPKNICFHYFFTTFFAKIKTDKNPNNFLDSEKNETKFGWILLKYSVETQVALAA